MILTSTRYLHRRLADLFIRHHETGLSRVSFLLLLSLLPLSGTLDESAEITDGDLEGEVKGGKHDSKEDPPAAHVGDESECTRSNEISLQFRHELL